MNRAPTLIVLGNACADLTLQVAALPRPGETVLAHAVREDLGGKGLNQAVAAARTGARVRFIGAVGTDAVADRIANLLRIEGVGDCLVRREGPSDRSVILLDATAENSIVTDARQAAALDPDSILTSLGIEPGDLLLLQGNLSRATTGAAIAVARAAGAVVALNAAPMRDWLAGLSADIMIANAGEATALAGRPETEAPEAMTAGLSASLAVVTLGGSGCVLRDGGLISHLPAPEVVARDTTGAGDVFCGVFCAEWLATGDPQAAARLAIRAASVAVTKLGTLSGIPNSAEIDRLRPLMQRTSHDLAGRQHGQ